MGISNIKGYHAWDCVWVTAHCPTKVIQDIAISKQDSLVEKNYSLKECLDRDLN